ncbi:MAG: cytochrome c [Bacteroidetes bacterium]|nr:cytochrome c [Bacteroidota bacterium]
MYKGMLHTHYLVVTLFLLIYLIKTILLLSNKIETLNSFTKKIKIPEMVISFLFLATGIFLATQLPFGSKYDYLFFIKVAMVLVSIPIAIIGFKKQNKLLAALSLLLITGSFGLAEVYHKRKGVSANGNTTIASNDGKALYEAKCGLCHGGDGKLAAAGAKDLSVTQNSLEEIKATIINGKNTMPAADVTPEEADAIANYVVSTIKSK